MRPKQTLLSQCFKLTNSCIARKNKSINQFLIKDKLAILCRRELFHYTRFSKPYLFIFLAFVFFSPLVQSQSSNCNCTGNLTENGTFEGSTLTGWTTPSQTSAVFLSGFDDCGSVSLRVSRVIGISLLDPAAWQQENNIEASKTYTLSFDAGTYDPSKVAKVYLRFYNVLGILLSEDYLEVNHDVDVDGQLQSYSFSMTSPTSASYARVALATQGDYLIVDNLCLVNSSCSSPILDFHDPVLVAGNAGAVGAKYKFNNVLPGVDVNMTITAKSHSDIDLYYNDIPSNIYGGYDQAYQPHIDYNWRNNDGSYDAPGEKSMTFRFDFVDAATGSPKTMERINMTGLDIDGDGGSVREFIQTSGFSAYELQSPTLLTLSGALKAKGSVANETDIDETALRAMISFVFENKNSITVTYGGDWNGSTYNISEERLNSLYFKCYDFNNPTACPTVSASGGKTICGGTSTVLTASMTGGQGSCALQWQSSIDNNTWTNISGATSQAYTTPNLNTTTYYRATYYCSGNTYCGVVYSNVETVTVDNVCIEICDNGIDDDHDGLVDCDDPDCGGTSVDAGADVTLCNGAQATFTAIATGGDAPYDFVWSNSLGTGATKTVNPTNTTTYTVTVTNANDCTTTDQVVVTVNQTPVANAGADVDLCRFFDLNLSASAIGGTTPYQYEWDNGLGNGSTHTIFPTTTTTYTVTVTSANGCNDTDQVTVSVQTCAENCSDGQDNDGDGLIDCDDPDCGPSVDAGFDVNICSGNTTTILASASGGNGSLTYLWSNGHVGLSQSVTPAISTTYTVTVTAPSGCSATAQVKVNIVPCGEDCTNGIDDDGDGLVDCDDPDCKATAAPSLMDDEYMTCPGMPFSERVTYNDDNLQSPVYSIYTQPTKGAVVIDGTGKFYFTPFGYECLTQTFMYQVCNQISGCCSEATVTIIFGDTTPPTLHNIPADVTISCDDAIPNPPNVTAFDECPGIYMDYDEVSTQNYIGACESYTITRTWIASDLCGNQTIEQQNITVVDNTKPEIFQVYTLANGKKVVAGVSKNVTHGWKSVSFPITFSETPMIFTSVITNRDMSAVTVRQRNAYSQGFEMRLYEQQSADGLHLGEDVSWIAIESGTNDDLLKLETARWQNINSNESTQNFSPLFGNSPGLITSIQSTNDTDPATVRISDLANNSVSVQVQEETSGDAETVHGYEHVSYLAFQPGVNLSDSKGVSFGETGKMNLTNAWTSVNFNSNYTKPVVIFGGISSNDSEGVNVRLRNVTGYGFEVSLQEWDYLDGNHSTESVSWMVVEGAIPGNMSYYCSGSVSDLQIGVNIFALDNCDDQTAFGYTETPTNTATGTLTARVWMAIDDCGNTNLITRFDTCSTAALRVRAKLNGPAINTNNGLMRDDLRIAAIIPLEEPFSSLPGFPHVTDTTPHANNQGGGNNGNNASNGRVFVCHRPGTASEVTLEINENALQAHLDHGDVVGSCSGNQSSTPEGAETAYYKTIADGNWTSASTWENGKIPPAINVIGRTIAIQHQVVLATNFLRLSGGTILWLSGGGLTINSGNFTVDNAEILAINSDLNLLNGSMILSDANSEVTLQNSTVNIIGDLNKSAGELWMENICLSVSGNFVHSSGLGYLFNMTAEVGGNLTNSSTQGLVLANSKVHVTTGFFQNDFLAKISGDSLIVWVENGQLTNLGVWTLPIKQYCIGGSASGLGGMLPLAEDCAGMADYFILCNEVIDPDLIVDEPFNTLDSATIAKSGTLDPTLLNIVGDDAIVDWLLLEIRDPNTEKVIQYATIVLQRDGDIMSEDGQDVINFPTIIEGYYIVSIRHRNHLPLMTDEPMFLSIITPPMIDFTDVSLPVRGGGVGGHIVNDVRMMWGGDFNEDNKVVYQGPNNDVFYLFSRALSDPGNVDFLANYIVVGYDLHDFNLDGKVIFQGPNNDRASLLYHSILAHKGNGGFLANFIVQGYLP